MTAQAAYLVLLDNGRQYSDHSRCVVRACPTLEDAIALSQYVQVWLHHRPIDPDFGGLDDLWVYDESDQRHPWPLGPCPDEARADLAEVSVLTVPVWARGMP